MEGLKTRTFLFAGILAVGGFAVWSTLMRSERPDKDEKWMEARAPERVGNLTFLRSENNPAQSYKMDETTYKVLAPFGIVCRTYTGNSGQVFDVVIIASESRGSFHDPRICFSASGWSLVEQRKVEVPTKTRGVVPVTLTLMDNQNRKGQLAAFFYKGPTGFHASTFKVKWDMVMQRVMRNPNTEGVFYRIIPHSETTSEEDLKAFIAEYLEASKASSDGYF